MVKTSTTVTLDNSILKWLDEGVKSHRFASKSHGIEVCIYHLMQEESGKIGEQGNGEVPLLA